MTAVLPEDVQSSDAPTFTGQEVADAVSAISQGQLALLKGDIGYGLFSVSERGLRKMYAVKGRPYSNPCIVIANADILEDIARIPNQRIRQWIADMTAWTTLAVVLPVRDDSRLLSSLPDWVYGQTVTNRTIAAFLSPGAFLDQVIAQAAATGIPLVGSSANPSSQGNIYEFADIPKHIVNAVDIHIDHGKSKYANKERRATTIVNFTNFTIKRRGVNWQKIEQSFIQIKESFENA